MTEQLWPNGENYVTWFDFMKWHEHKGVYYSEPYCVHRNKRTCKGDIDYMQVRTVYYSGKPRVKYNGLCHWHFAYLKGKGVPFVERPTA